MGGSVVGASGRWGADGGQPEAGGASAWGEKAELGWLTASPPRPSLCAVSRPLPGGPRGEAAQGGTAPECLTRAPGSLPGPGATLGDKGDRGLVGIWDDLGPDFWPQVQWCEAVLV